MNIKLCNACTGCFACVDKCPKKCITTAKDELGHYKPYVSNNCVDCGLCVKCCPQMNPCETSKPDETWASWRKDEDERKISSSGGMASAVAETILKHGGVVYGSAFIMPFDIKHIRCTSLEDLNRLKGSKYVQSNTEGIYKQIAADLKLGAKVLFIGTPCQVAGVRNYFCGKYTNLYLIDVLCHGVPSVQICKESLPKGSLSLDYDNFTFRENDSYQLRLKKGKNVIWTRPLKKDLYLKGFFTSIFNRDSCCKCQYAKLERVGDLSIGDFWGVDEDKIGTSIKNGVSLCFINNANGKKLIKMALPAINYHNCDISESLAGNAPLNHASGKSWRLKVFRALYPRFGMKISSFMAMPDIMIKNYFFC